MARVAAALALTDTATSLDTVTFELVASGALPVLDMSRSVRRMWMPPWLANKWATFIRRFHLPILLGVYTSLVLDFFSVFLHAAPGRWCAVLALVLGTPGCVVRVTLLRSDAVRLLLGTYEYWFFTTTSVFAVTFLGFYVGDARAASIPGMWIGFQSCILVDADVASARHYMNATAAMLLFITALTVLVFLEMVEDVNHFELVRDEMRAVSVETAFANAGVIVIVMLSRNLYRRRAAAKKASTDDSHVNKVYCISYRCRIKLVRVESLDAVVPVDAPALNGDDTIDSMASDSVATTTTLTRLELVKAEHQFNAACVVCPAVQRCLLRRGDVPWIVRTATLALASTGAVTSVLSFALPSVDPTARLRIQAVALVSSSVVVFVGVCLLQREMLKRLVGSFDFAFLSIQLTPAHVAACDLFSWDGRCLVVTASWLWMHLVLSLDALTPLVKARWHFRVQFAAPVLLLFLAAQIATAAVIVLDGDYDLRDRVVYRVHVHHRTIAVKVAAFTIGRIATLLGWSLRMLWRIWHQRGDELILSHGSVCYETKLAQVRRRKTDAIDDNRAPHTSAAAAAVVPMSRFDIAGAAANSRVTSNHGDDLNRLETDRAIATNGDVYVWGNGQHGQLGTGTQRSRRAPTKIRLLHNKHVTQLAFGEWHSMALCDGGALYTWGFGEEGQLGLPDDDKRPSRIVPLPTLIHALAGTGATMVRCGGSHTFVVSVLEARRPQLARMHRRTSQSEVSRESDRIAVLARSTAATARGAPAAMPHHDSDRKLPHSRSNPSRGASLSDVTAASPGEQLKKKPSILSKKTSQTEHLDAFAAASALTHRDLDDTPRVPLDFSWRERPLTSRTAVRNALRQEVKALSEAREALTPIPIPTRAKTASNAFISPRLRRLHDQVLRSTEAGAGLLKCQSIVGTDAMRTSIATAVDAATTAVAMTETLGLAMTIQHKPRRWLDDDSGNQCATDDDDAPRSLAAMLAELRGDPSKSDGDSDSNGLSARQRGSEDDSSESDDEICVAGQRACIDLERAVVWQLSSP